jgi:protein tyrosine/serine phosphatase
MSINYINADNSDNSIIKYSQYALTRTRQFFTNYYHAFEAHEIFNNVYIGSIESVYDIEELKNRKINNIISVISDFNPPYPNEFNYLIVNALDTHNTDLTNVFDTTNKFIEKSLDEDNEPILIHCYAGKSRSVSILIAYIMYKYGMCYEDALKAIKQKREFVNPNEKFREQLIKYYNEKYNV